MVQPGRFGWHQADRTQLRKGTAELHQSALLAGSEKYLAQ